MRVDAADAADAVAAAAAAAAAAADDEDEDAEDEAIPVRFDGQGAAARQKPANTCSTSSALI